MTRTQFEAELEKCTTLKQVFNLCEQHYEIENCKLGVMSKPLVLMGISKALTMLNPKPRTTL